MKNWSIKTRILLAACLPLIFWVSLGLFVWSSIVHIQGYSERISRTYLPLAHSASELAKKANLGITNIKDYFNGSGETLLHTGITNLESSLLHGVEVEQYLRQLGENTELNQDITILHQYVPPYLEEVKKLSAVLQRRENELERLQDLTVQILDSMRQFHHSHESYVTDEQTQLFTVGETFLLHGISTLVSSFWQARESLNHATSPANRTQAEESLLSQAKQIQLDVLKLITTHRHGNCEQVLGQMNLQLFSFMNILSNDLPAVELINQRMEKVRQNSNNIQEAVQNIFGASLGYINVGAQQLAQTSSTSTLRILIGSGITALLSLIASLMVAKTIIFPLGKCLGLAERVAQGDLRERLNLDSKDEVGRLADAINCMLDNLSNRINDLSHMEGSMRRTQALTMRSLELANAGSWTIIATEPDMIVLSPQLDVLLGGQGLGQERHVPLTQWLKSIAAINPEQAALVGQYVAEMIDGQRQTADITYPVLLPDGRAIWIREVFESMLYHQQKKRSIFGIAQDITNYIEQQKILEDATIAQGRFISNMSHEIRTPMNAIIGIGHLLRTTNLTPQQKEYLDKLNSSAGLLLGLLNDILDLSKIEAGKMTLECIPFKVHELLNSARDMISDIAELKGLRFNTLIDPSLPPILMGDPLRLQQIITNLVNNATKFTEHGGISLEIHLVKDDIQPDAPDYPAYLSSHGDAVRVRICVQDSGIGMEEEACQRLFQPFTQADGSITRRFGGTGLGLTICRRLTEAMGGNIEVVSRVGEGSTFEVSLILGRGESPNVDIFSAEGDFDDDDDDLSINVCSKAGLVLLVEDNEINQFIATDILELMGHTVEIANNGAEALEKMALKDYSIVLMDIQMPIMDGISAAMKIRENPKWLKIPIIAMTAHAMQSDRLRSLEAGMNDHITKPIDPTLLYQVLEHWL